MAPRAGSVDRPGAAPPGPPPLVLLGASVRPLAESAARAGFDVYAADLFADLDLAATARECVCVAADPTAPADGRAGAPYPWSLGDAALRFPAAAPWCYTGALENHPLLIAAIAGRRPLAGNGPGPLRVLRDWRSVAAAARESGAAFPPTFSDPAGLPTDGTFLVKPRAGAGGRGILPWTGGTAAALAAGGRAAARSPHIWQRLVAGAAWSATVVMRGGAARLVGVSRQLVGERWCRAPAFAWCGAVAVPGRREPPFAAPLARLADELAARSEAVGLVGIDLVVDPAATPHVLEVNPRPTASMELFERSGRLRLAADHLVACGVDVPPRPGAAPAPPADVTWAKGVLFTRGGIVVDERRLARLAARARPWTEADGGWPAVADIPRPGQALPAGSPVVSIFARGDGTAETVAALRDRVAAVEQVVAG